MAVAAVGRGAAPGRDVPSDRHWNPNVPSCIKNVFRARVSYFYDNATIHDSPEGMWPSMLIPSGDPALLQREEAMDPQHWLRLGHKLLFRAPEFANPQLYPGGPSCKLCGCVGHVRCKAWNRAGPRFMEPGTWVICWSYVHACARRGASFRSSYGISYGQSINQSINHRRRCQAPRRYAEIYATPARVRRRYPPRVAAPR
jgi:hypothetical protein